MKMLLRSDISPCVTKDPTTGIGIVLIPGQTLDFEAEGIPDAEAFIKAHRWAFDSEVVEQATAEPGQKRLFSKRS
jgi:hypothetical protein